MSIRCGCAITEAVTKGVSTKKHDTSFCLIHHPGYNAHIKQITKNRAAKCLLPNTEELIVALGVKGHSFHLSLIQSIDNAMSDFKRRVGFFPNVSRQRVQVLLGWSARSSSMVEYYTRTSRYWDSIVNRIPPAAVMANLYFDSKTLYYLTTTGKKFPMDSLYFNNNHSAHEHIALKDLVNEIMSTPDPVVQQDTPEGKNHFYLSITIAKKLARYALKGLHAEEAEMTTDKALAVHFEQANKNVKDFAQIQDILNEECDDWEDIDMAVFQ
jgi:hypothetical protein